MRPVQEVGKKVAQNAEENVKQKNENVMQRKTRRKVVAKKKK